MDGSSSQRLDKALITKAVKALFAYEAKKANNSNQLIGNYAKPILVQVQLVKEISAPVQRPVRVKIPHSSFSPSGEDHTVCLFCRTEDKEELTAYVEAHPIEGLAKVVSINDVKKIYARTMDKKKLLAEHTHFVCDARVMSQLYNLLGKTFATRNNYPVPVDFKRVTKLEEAVMKSVDSTYMHLKGSNITIRFGHLAMNPKDVSANIVEGLLFAVEKFKDGWKNVHSVHIKTSDSEALPVYSKIPSEELKHVQKLAKAKETEKANAKSSKSGGKKEATGKVSAKTKVAPVKKTRGGKDKGTEVGAEKIEKAKRAIRQASGRKKRTA